MKRVETFEKLQEVCISVRNKREGFITNFYPEQQKHGVWIKRGVLSIHEISNTVFVIKDNGSFWHVFYITTTLEELEKSIQGLINEFPQTCLVLDVVGREKQCQPIIEILQNNGLSLAATLVRMQGNIASNQDIPYVDEVVKAAERDVIEISRCLHEYFNDKLEQIPYNEELVSYIKQDRILIIKRDGVIAGFLIYELSSSTLYLRYWFAKPEYREMRVGGKLLRQFFYEGKCTKRQILWVLTNNENAIKRYTHYGFKNEDMFDYIYVRNLNS